ncbi:MAG: hypothetical protein R3B09_20870 [Nannocystaceae bacterium]
MRPRRLHAALALSLACTASTSEPPPRFAPGVDVAAARAQLRRDRVRYFIHRATVEGCERRSPERCEVDGRCEASVDFGDYGTGGPTVCRAKDAVLHAYLQEQRRRECHQTPGASWWVYQSTGGSNYGDCVPPDAASAEEATSVVEAPVDGRVESPAPREDAAPPGSAPATPPRRSADDASHLP